MTMTPSNLPRRLCITGGTGFIGRYFCEQFAQHGVAMSLLDLHPPAPEFTLPAGSTFVRGDVRDPIAVRTAMNGCDAVLALAAAHHDFGIKESTYYAVNEHGSQVICDVMDELGVTDACFYSSVAVFGTAPEPRREDSPTQPDSPYGGSKLKGEAVFQRWTERGGARRCLVIRPTVTFGPRNFANMYSLIRQIHSGKFLAVGDGSNIKSLAYVENIVEATLFLWERWRDATNAADGAKPRAFDIVQYIDKPDLTSREIVATIRRALGRKPSKLRLPLWLGVALGLPFDLVIKLTGRNLPVSTARIRKLCAQTKFEADKVRAAGFVPSISLPQGIERMVQWYLAEGKDQKAEWHLPPDEVMRA